MSDKIKAQQEELELLNKALQTMAEDFIAMCPAMEKVACTPDALVCRYENYKDRPLLPEKDELAELVREMPNLCDATTEVRLCVGEDFDGDLKWKLEIEDYLSEDPPK